MDYPVMPQSQTAAKGQDSRVDTAKVTIFSIKRETRRLIDNRWNILHWGCPRKIEGIWWI